VAVEFVVAGDDEEALDKVRQQLVVHHVDVGVELEADGKVPVINKE